MNGGTPPFQPIGGLSPFLMPPAMGPAEAKLFEQLQSAHLNNNNNVNFPLNATFAPLVPPSNTISNSQAGHSGPTTSSSPGPNGSSSSPPSTNPADNPERNTPEYLQQLLKDKRSVQELGSSLFQHVDRILDDEIFRVRLQLFHISLTNLVEPTEVPEPNGSPVVTLTEKVYIPTKEHPEFNFVGRLLGPRGTTAKFLEHVLETKIMVRGKGSMREKRLEDQYRGKPHWEHLKDELHVLLTVETNKNRAEQVVKRACQAITKFLEVIPEGQDELKKRQLMELAILNGTYRDTTKPQTSSPQTAVPQPQAPRLFQTQLTVPQLRSPNAGGAPILLAGPPRLPTHPPTSAPGLLNHHGGHPIMSSPTDTPHMMFPYDYSAAYAAALSPQTFFEYPGLAGDVAGRPFFHPCISPPLQHHDPRNK